MIELESQFDQMREVPLPEGLFRIEHAVLSGAMARREAKIARRGLIVAGAVSLVIGLSAGLVPAGKAQAEPLLSVPAKAPSRLLGL